MIARLFAYLVVRAMVFFAVAYLLHIPSLVALVLGIPFTVDSELRIQRALGE